MKSDVGLAVPDAGCHALACVGMPIGGVVVGVGVAWAPAALAGVGFVGGAWRETPAKTRGRQGVQFRADSR